ncbi:MAG: universal stress protein [Candidatus Acidiferrales bacterium]
MKTLDVASQLKLKNILYPTDLSFAAERALPYASEIARRYGSTVYAVHVIQPDVYPFVPSTILPKTVEAEEVFRQESKEDLETQLHAVPHEVIFQSGKAWPTLSEFIEDKQIDLVVFSTHGRTGIGNVVVGSIAEEIFRKAPCPVLAVGPAVTMKPRENAELNRILYATDFSTESLAAAPYAISLAQEHRAQLILLHSIENGGIVPALLDTLRQLVPFEADLRCEPDCVVEHGAPADKILEVAEGHGADLIVLGVHGMEGPIQKHLTSSGVFRIVTEAKCPVMLVRG